MLAECQSDGPREDHDHSGANGGGEVGVDVRHADFGEQCGCGCEDGREKCPSDPGHDDHAIRAAR